MIEIQQLVGPLNIPIYYQRMPEMVGAVAMAWVVFTGASDDTTIGQPGLYHWFEHVPFRGTKKFPGGYDATRGWATRYSGYVNAFTNSHCTRYEVSVPTHVWRKGLEVITDLVSQPLVEDAAVAAERDIIRQEMAFTSSQLQNWAPRRIAELLYPGHPYGNQVLGTEATLDKMDASILRKAWQKGYDHSRLAFICIGHIPAEDLLHELKNLAHLLPDNRLNERRAPVFQGEFPRWQNGAFTTEETNFASSLVCMLFPLDRSAKRRRVYFDTCIVEDVFTEGSLASPLYKVIREERNLAYAASCNTRFLPGGGHFGFWVETKKNNVDKVVTALQHVISHPIVTTADRLEIIKESIPNAFKMRPINPNQMKDVILHRHLSTGEIINDHDFTSEVENYSLKQVSELVSRLTPNRAHTFVFVGKS